MGRLLDEDLVIDVVRKWFDKINLNGDICIDGIISLPSAHPEIVRCVDCAHSDTFPTGADNDMPLKCLGIRYGGVMPDWFCEHAERRTDE